MAGSLNINNHDWERRWQPVLLLVFCSVCFSLFCLIGCGDGEAVDQEEGKPAAPTVSRASQLYQQGDQDGALSVLQQVMIQSPDDAEAMALAVEIYAARKMYVEAATLATQVAQANPSLASTAMIRAFDWNLKAGEFAEAEKNLRQGINLAPRDPGLRHTLIQFLNGQGRRSETREHVVQLIRLRAVQPGELLSLVDLRAPFPMVSYEPFLDPKQPSLFWLGDSRMSLAQNNSSEALNKTQQLINAFPENASVQAFWGRLLVESDQMEAFGKWVRGALPDDIAVQPEYWDALAVWLEQSGQTDQAVRCWCESLRLDPTNRNALRKLVAVDTNGDKSLDTSKARETLAGLDKVFRIAKGANPDQSRWIAESMIGWVRPWESLGWKQMAAASGKMQSALPELNAAAKQIAAWESKAKSSKLLDARLNSMLGFDYKQWPLPEADFLAKLARSGRNKDGGQLETDILKFTDQASQIGIKSKLSSGYFDKESTFFIYQTNGGGIGVLDYDLDGWCDVYFAQSGGTPNKSDSKANELYRFGSGMFHETAGHAGVDDQGFGQGICVGDINQDGWPDLLVANIGSNEVFLNQGDGTFHRASDQVKDNQPRWTSSLAVADVDGDHLPEIIEANYLDDPEAFTVPCRGKELDCAPQRFLAAQDWIHHNNGRGGFETWVSADRIASRKNYGFGIIVANFDDANGNEVFISNDGDLNHYWVSVNKDGSAGKWTLNEAAGIRGCSIGAKGMSQACMGVASSDFDRNGRLDLHITNFHNESSNLFLQDREGFFVDRSQRTGITDQSKGVLGFGTQAADFDNDGWEDLAVLNGHIYDASARGIPFQMLPQVLRGHKRGFVQQDHAGGYFARKQLGRTLAKLDWNRDGKLDLVANHLDHPMSVLTNESPAGNWLQVQLIGTQSERDAIGAKLVVTSGDQSWTQWQVGGDGYMCTNESVVHFGLGSSQEIESLSIHWPSGIVETFKDTDANCRLIVVEGHQELSRIK